MTRAMEPPSVCLPVAGVARPHIAASSVLLHYDDGHTRVLPDLRTLRKCAAASLGALSGTVGAVVVLPPSYRRYRRGLGTANCVCGR